MSSFECIDCQNTDRDMFLDQCGKCGEEYCGDCDQHENNCEGVE